MDTLAHASSSKSIALSGSCLFIIYLTLQVTACSNATSEIVTPWKSSNFSFNHNKIANPISGLGSETESSWNLLFNAGSFSIYFWYSSNVVAQIICIFPLLNKGFNIFAASAVHSALHAPIIVWISSTKIIILFRGSIASSSTAFNLASNSPLYFVQAIIAPISSIITLLFCNLSGTFFSKILVANHSTIAVFHTHASQINNGLFFVFLNNV